ncbi:MAG TPA: aminoglycoside phosphotransferase family protein [Acidimicrobiia bacterium]|nr:aminoglycoside phosphotransferase family protein [Acidimicrobiia bacterium]
MPCPDAIGQSLRTVAERFTGPLTAIRPFGTGHINDTFLVATAAGEYVVQRINTAVFHDPDAVTANILAVYRHVRGAMVPEPVPTADRSGNWLVHDADGGVWRAWHRAPGEPRAAEDAGPAELRSAAALLGRFHALAADLTPDGLTETLPRFHDPARRLEDLRAVVAADPCGRVATARDEIAAAEAAEPLAGLATDLMNRVPTRVAHFDAKLDNILFSGDDAVCLVDLDTVMPGAWFWDVGDLLRSGATAAAEDDRDLDRAVVQAERYEAIVGGYREALGAPVAGPPTAAEFEAIDAAGAIVTYEQAVRFLTDWIAGDVYYRIERPEQNLDRARAQFRLLASMPGA